MYIQTYICIYVCARVCVCLKLYGTHLIMYISLRAPKFLRGIATNPSDAQLDDQRPHFVFDAWTKDHGRQLP